MINIKDLPKDFDWQFYLNFYEDLRKAGIKTEVKAKLHYLSNGKKENRVYRQKFKPISSFNQNDKILIYKNICEKLLEYLETTYPTVDKNSKNKSLIVESRWDKQIEFTIKNTIQKLGDGWGHIICCTENNFKEINNLKNEISLDIEVINLGDISITRNSYNNLLLSLDFWNKINCKKVLIYQWDSFIFKEFDKNFLKWDYIGAPWGPSKHSKQIKKDYNLKFEINFGNGGLSLRSVDALIEVLKYEIPIKNNSEELDFIFEDVFFSYNIQKMSKYKTPLLEEVRKFSFEHEFYEDTFGCHQPFVNSYENKNLFDKFLKKFKGVNVYGFGNLDIGLGQNMRSIIESLKKSKILFNINCVNSSSNKNYLIDEDFNYFETNLVLCNPSWDVVKDCGLEYFDGKYNIGLWAWEMPDIPNSWVSSSKNFDEIWTISEFCKHAINKSITNKPIKVLNIPTNFFVKKNKVELKNKLNLKDKFVCFFSFDYGSDVNRKNPFDVIKSFKSAFINNEDVVLIIKTHNCSDNYFLTNKEFNNEKIILINKTLDRESISELFNCTDLYISLHRSEGSGLTIMEAINLEIPVVCTNYSGNLDFCDDNCQLVNYQLIPVKGTHPDYIEINNKTVWAQPDIDDASKKMIEVYSNYEFFSEKIKITKKKLYDNYSIEKLSKSVKEFLKNRL